MDFSGITFKIKVEDFCQNLLIYERIDNTRITEEIEHIKKLETFFIIKLLQENKIIIYDDPDNDLGLGITDENYIKEWNKGNFEFKECVFRNFVYQTQLKWANISTVEGHLLKMFDKYNCEIIKLGEI